MPKRTRACKLDCTIRGRTVITREQAALFVYLMAQDNARRATVAPAPIRGEKVK